MFYHLYESQQVYPCFDQRNAKTLLCLGFDTSKKIFYLTFNRNYDKIFVYSISRVPPSIIKERLALEINDSIMYIRSPNKKLPGLVLRM